MYIGDLHIHSRYSRATSRECTPEHLDLWARRKGIHIIGTGDFTHPEWRRELQEKLEPAEDGFYTLKNEYRIENDLVPGEMSPRFVVTGEISSIYKKNGKVRKVHSLIILPGLEEAEKISVKLEQIGNIHSDGRPILGLDCHDLLEIVLELCPRAVYVPAHIWTPHFSVFGAFSGFDTVEECFEDLTPYINAVETGLSSDPPMNWRVSGLDGYQLISNSDAHSPAKLGREATLFEMTLSYEGLYRAIQTGEGLGGTIEFFPEEGKYHMDGHRKCNLCLTPSETMKYGGRCPVCGRKITIGVSHRIEELADRAEGYVKPGAKLFERLVPLPEVLGASQGHSATSVKVQREYQRLLTELGPEFEILRNIPSEDIRRVAGSRVAEGICRLRNGQVERIPGFDGEYGVIRLFSADELNNTEGQMNFFDLLGNVPADAACSIKKLPEEPAGIKTKEKPEAGNPQTLYHLNSEQEYAVRCTSSHIAVQAGPGTGKTKTLVSRLRYLLEYRKARPSEITAVTFTNQAAREMRERIVRETGSRQTERSLQIGTFHSICLNFLREQGEMVALMSEVQKRRLAADGTEMYEKRKKALGLYDFDDLLLRTVKYIENGEAEEGWKKRFRYLLVDEFQDIDPVQLRLVQLWSAAGQELFVIGDRDQSIYGFRGADSKCFDHLQEIYQDLEVIRLKENYRSSPQILGAATAVIRKRNDGVPELHPNCSDGNRVRLVKAGSPMGEAVFIAKEISRMTGGLGMLEAHENSWKDPERQIRSFDQIAVLCRTHHQAQLVEKCLRTEGIPYIVSGNEEYLQAESVQNSICFFHLCNQPADPESERLCAEYFWKLPWNDIAEEIVEEEIRRWQPLYAKKKPRKFLEQWMEERQLADDSDMQKLVQASVFYDKMDEFISSIDLGKEGDVKRCGGKRYNAEAVTVMTLHGSKGLEFPTVFIYGVEKGSIPLESENHPADKEEERRLFYVGMTRAKEELILTMSGEASEFTSVIPAGVMEHENLEKKKKGEEWHQMSLFEM